MSDLVGNPEDRFSHTEAHFKIVDISNSACLVLLHSIEVEHHNHILDAKFCKKGDAANFIICLVVANPPDHVIMLEAVQGVCSHD